jgi:hypothetical protein
MYPGYWFYMLQCVISYLKLESVNLIGSEPSREWAAFRSSARKIFSGQVIEMLHVCHALDFFHILSASILIVDSICVTVTNFFHDFVYIWLIHRKEMCRFGLTSGRTRQANMIFVSWEWSEPKIRAMVTLTCVHLAYNYYMYCAVHSRIWITDNVFSG